ncbi:hypothetical protein M378DRAFT_182392 [Amanita muscaria Koide BX008]|uniref:Transposase n=1 Tax=Amanita muscaria (strain Koide BX008) TaxID=946122 RepID=A0A0C2W176_AMAMK|nr:hypothetical protein M378DRAFT_182392 [Amanita muscaria Koide BX008]
MARREHDRPNLNLIIEGSRKVQPSKRIQGQDYPVTALQELQERDKELPKSVANSSKSLPKASSSLNEHEEVSYVKDAIKPVGEAVREDGTLKDASEMDWPHSPSEYNGPSLAAVAEYDAGVRSETRKWGGSEQIESDLGANELPKTKKRVDIWAVDSNSANGDDASSDNDSGKSNKTSKKSVKKAAKTKHLVISDKESDADSPTDNGNGETTAVNVTSDVNNPQHVAKAKDSTKDLHLCGKNGSGTHPKKNTAIEGWYCKFCLEQNRSKTAAFLTGNVTLRRRHLLRCHLHDYWNTCLKNNITPTKLKDWIFPIGWVPPNECDTTNPGSQKQQSIGNYVQKTAKPPPIPPVMKAGIQEHLLAIIATCDLPFRFVERPAVCDFITYLNYKLQDNDIPKKSCIAAAVNTKVALLENLTLDIIDVYSTYIRRCPLSGMAGPPVNDAPSPPSSISFIDSPQNDDAHWELKNYLLEFSSPVGRHTGELIGQDLVAMIQKFHLESKGTRPNEEAPEAQASSYPHHVAFTSRCINHSMHRAAYHFIQALGVPSLSKTKRNLQVKAVDDTDATGEAEDGEDDSDERDVDVSMDLQRSLITIQAVDYFCLTADANEDLAPLKNKTWSDYRLTTAEWKLIKLVHHCLKLVVAWHNELSNEELATCTRVLPMLELLMSEWEDLLEDPDYEPVHEALRAGIQLLEKYYRRADDTNGYCISHILDPTLKREYLNAIWDDKYLDLRMERFKAQCLVYKKKYETSQTKSSSLPSTAPSTGILRDTTFTFNQADFNLALLSTDTWMESLIKKKQQKKGKARESESALQESDPFEELH